MSPTKLPPAGPISAESEVSASAAVVAAVVVVVVVAAPAARGAAVDLSPYALV